MRTTSSDSGGPDFTSAGDFPNARAFWSSCGLPADRLDEFLAHIERYRQLIVDGNRITSLVAEDSLRDFDTKHVCDSLAVLRAFPSLLSGLRGQACPPCESGAVAAESSSHVELPFSGAKLKVADLGSGAGLPGLVLALALPDISLTAIEPNGKKAQFLSKAIGELGLAGRVDVATKPGRELGRDAAFAGRYDVVLARAVSSADKLINECRRLIAPAGCMVFYKTPASVQEELSLTQREARKHKLDVVVSEAVELPAGAGARQFILLRPEVGGQRPELSKL